MNARRLASAFFMSWLLLRSGGLVLAEDELGALYQRSFRALEERDLERAVAGLTRYLRSFPRHQSAAYNLACAYALKRASSESIAWLSRAVDLGYDDLAHLQTDGDLASIRDHAGYRAALAVVRRRSENPPPEPERSDRGLKLVAMLRGELGSGAAIALGRSGQQIYLATADHLVRRGPTQARAVQLQFMTQAPRWIEARVLPALPNRSLDLAIIAVDTLPDHEQKFCQLPLPFDAAGDAAALARGDPVSPVGYPNGSLWAMPFNPDRVSQVFPEQLSFESQFIRVGYSGGALINTRGEVVAMITADEPPYGRALPLRAIKDAATSAGYSVQLTLPHERTTFVLHAAARANDLALLRRMLVDCADPNALDGAEQTALHAAAAAGHVEAVRLLLQAGARHNAWGVIGASSSRESWSRDWGTPLHVAATQNQPEVVRALVAAGADVNLATLHRGGQSPTEQFDNALHLAAKHDHAEVAAALLDLGADLSIEVHDRRPLEIAARSGAVKVVNLLLGRGASVKPLQVTVKTYSGAERLEPRAGPLHNAAYSGSTAIINLLLRHGADVNAPSRYGSPLHFACAKGHAEAARLLIARKAEVNAKGDGGASPLHRAVEEGFEDTVKLLLASGADPNLRNDRDQSPLDLAEQKTNLEILRALLRAKANVGYALHSALERANTPAAKLLIQGGADLSLRDSSGVQPLHIAASRGLSEAVKVLLSHGASVRALTARQGDSPLQLAAEAGELEVVELLIAAHAPIDQHGDGQGASDRTALYRAVDAGHAEIVRRLLQAHADPSLESRYSNAARTPLGIAAKNAKRTAILAMLLDAGADPNQSGQGIRQSPLYLAAGSGSLDNVRLLLAARASVRSESERNTPLHAAAAHGRGHAPELIRMLVEAGCSVDARDQEGLTPLAIAARSDNVAAVKMLLAKRAHVNSEDKCGATPLWFAVTTHSTTESLEVIQVLLDAGADANMKNRCTGQTMLDVAERREDLAVRQVLVSRGVRGRR